MNKLLILIFMILLNPNLFSQENSFLKLLPEKQQWDLSYLPQNNIFNISIANKKPVYASLGFGINITGGIYTASLRITPQFHPNFKISAGPDIYYTSSSGKSTIFAVNLTPYLVINLNRKSNFDIGPGISYISRKVAFTPSLIFETFIKENTKIGVELRYPVYSGLDLTFLPFMIFNLSFKI